MSAYYSRNNSYSRSYNATQAENEDRYPLTRAAKHLGLSVKAFKNGLESSNIGASEWHHVGKYANEVNYYDVSDSSEIVMSLLFWKGAKNKANSELCDSAIKNIIQVNLKEKTKIEIPGKQVIIKSSYWGGDEYSASLSYNSSNNLNKAIREIYRLREPVRKSYVNPDVPPSLQRIKLCMDGTIRDRKGRVIKDICLDDYEPKWIHPDGVQYLLINQS